MLAANYSPPELTFYKEFTRNLTYPPAAAPVAL